MGEDEGKAEASEQQCAVTLQLSGRVIRKALIALRVRSKRRRTPFWPDLAHGTLPVRVGV